MTEVKPHPADLLPFRVSGRAIYSAGARRVGTELYPMTAAFIVHAANNHARLVSDNARMRAALEWYAEQVRLCRLIHSEGDAGRNALADDGGKRAREALTPEVKP